MKPYQGEWISQCQVPPVSPAYGRGTTRTKERSEEEALLPALVYPCFDVSDDGELVFRFDDYGLPGRLEKRKSKDLMRRTRDFFKTNANLRDTPRAETVKNDFGKIWAERPFFVK